MALLANQNASSLDGATITPVSAAGGGDTMVGGSGRHLYINNGGGSPITVTLVTPETVEGSLAVADRAIVVTNGTWKFIPVPNRYNATGTGVASITYSGVTTVTVAAVEGRTAP